LMIDQVRAGKTCSDFKIIGHVDASSLNSSATSSYVVKALSVASLPNPPNLAYININLRGGAALNANALMLDINGAMLPSYSSIGGGTAANIITTMEMGIPWQSTSGLLLGLRSVLTLEELKKAQAFVLPAPSLNDTSSNRLDISGAVFRSGRVGRDLGHVTLGSPGMQSAFSDLPKGRLEISNLSGLTNLMYDVSTYDIRTDANLSAIWGVTPTTFVNDTNLGHGSLATAALKGRVGTVSIQLGGFDYHNATRTTGDEKDRQAGVLLGRVIKSALALNKPVFINLSTDGCVQSLQSDFPGAPWVGDSTKCAQMFFLVNPSGTRYPAGSLPVTQHIGYFDINQNPSSAFWSATDDAQVINDNVGAAILANYLVASGKASLIPSLTGGRVKDSRDAKFVRVKSAIATAYEY
jgi:hypothetical protein